MKAKLLLALTLCFFIIPTAYAGGVKIGVIDTKRVFAESKAGQSAKKRMEEYAKEQSAPIKAKKATLDRMQQEIQSNMMMSPSMKQQKEVELRQKAGLFQQEVQSMQQRMQSMQAMEMQNLAKKIASASESVGKKKKLDLVFDISIAQGVFYSSIAKKDITADIIKQLNKAK